MSVWLRQDHICDLKALLKGTKLLLPAYGNQTCAPLSIDQHMQGPDLALADSGSWHQSSISNCAADDNFRKGKRGPCSNRCFLQVLLKYYCHVAKAKVHGMEMSDVEITLSELAFVVNEVSAGS